MGAETFHSSHKMHHPEIELTGPDTATGVWALDDTVIDTQWNITIRGASFYNDEYVKQDGAWKIHRTSYRRVFEEIQPRGNVEGLVAHRFVVGHRRPQQAPRRLSRLRRVGRHVEGEHALGVDARVRDAGVEELLPLRSVARDVDVEQRPAKVRTGSGRARRSAPRGRAP